MVSQEMLEEAVEEAEALEFEYIAPKAARIKALVVQAAGHVIARERLLPQVEAAKMRGHPQYDALLRDADLHKACLGRIWLQVKAQGMSSEDFRTSLDQELLAAVVSR